MRLTLLLSARVNLLKIPVSQVCTFLAKVCLHNAKPRVLEKSLGLLTDQTSCLSIT